MKFLGKEAVWLCGLFFFFFSDVGVYCGSLMLFFFFKLKILEQKVFG